MQKGRSAGCALEDIVQNSEFSVYLRGDTVPIFEFEEFQLKPDEGLLFKGGAPVALQPQVLTLLIYLVQNRDRIISKDELIDALWDGRIVSDAALNTRIRDVRRVLEDDGREQRFIKTFPKRGVQFVADTTVPSAEILEPARGARPRRRLQFAALAVAFAVAIALVFATLDRPSDLPITDQPSLAVLKFTTDTSDERDFVAEGMAEDLIADLSQFKELFVISRSTSFTLDTETADPRALREELGVAFVARGSVRRAGDDLRVTAELIDTETGGIVWSERFQRPLSDVFDIQDEISDAIAGRILPELVRARVTATRNSQSDDLSAWDLLLQAKSHQTVFTRDGQERAISLARAALDRDPGLASAHSLIAQARGNLFFWSDGDVDVRDAAIASARQALEMDPNDPMAHAALGYVYRFTGDETRAIGNLERAVELNPNSALIRLQFGHTLDWFRHQDRALSEIERAIRLSPRDPLLQNMLFYKAHILFHLARYEESLAAADGMAAVLSSGPWEMFYHLMRASALAEMGRADEAQAAIDAVAELNPSLTLSALQARFDRTQNHPENRANWLASLKKAGLSG